MKRRIKVGDWIFSVSVERERTPARILASNEALRIALARLMAEWGLVESGESPE